MQPVGSRYHALDALRAAMMFLGIYLHAAAAYSPHGDWNIKPPQVTTALDYPANSKRLHRRSDEVA